MIQSSVAGDGSMLKRNIWYVKIPDDKLFEINVYRSKMELSLPCGHKWGPQIRDHVLFYHCITGRGVLTLNGTPHNISAGQYYFAPSDCLVHLCADDVDPWQYHYLILKGTRLFSYLEQMGVSAENPIVPCPENMVINACLDRLCVINSDSDLIYDLALEMERCALIYQIFSELIRTATPGAPVVSVQQEYIRKACRYMNKNLSSKIKTDHLASYVGLDRRYFSTIFRRFTGQSPLQYLHKLRMHKAQELLSQPQQSVKSTAALVGLEYQTFCRQFKKEFSLTPSQFKKQSGKSL